MIAKEKDENHPSQKKNTKNHENIYCNPKRNL